MKKSVLLLTAAALFSSVSLATDSLSAAQKSEVTQLIEQTLQKKPELIIKSIVNFRQAQMAKAKSEAEKQVNAHANEIFNAKHMPVLGNLKGDATAVEFLDYQCHHCQDMSSVVEEVIKQDHKARFIVRELPIFGGESTTAAKAALAANIQGKFPQMHKALFALKPPINHDMIMAAAKKAGLDIHRLKKDMKSDKVAAQLKANFALAKKLNIMATPTFIVGSAHRKDNVLASGGMPAQALQQLLDNARS